MAEEKKQSAEQISETLVNAMGMIAENAVHGLSFDKTEIAEIVDITNRENGDYVVFNGSARYHAYTENTSYTLGTKVYVNIPNNDMSGEKTIIRKYNLKDSNRGLNYISPWDRFTPASPDLLKDNNIPTREFKNDYNNEQGIGLLANYNKIEKKSGGQEIELFSVTSMGDLYSIAPNFQNYKYMGLSADFRSLLSGYKPTAGNYGIKLVGTFERNREGTEDADMIKETHTYVLDSKNMIGSIYNFFTDFEQQAVFELPNPEEHWIITSLKGYFFQDGDFYANGELIPAIQEVDNSGNNILYEDNLFVKNIKIRFGHDKADTYDTDVVKIYTLGTETYDGTQKNEDLNMRRVYLNWMHRNPDTATEDDPYGVLEEIKNISNIPNNSDLTFKANIWWLRTSVHTLDEYRQEQNEANTATNKKIKLQTLYLQDAENIGQSGTNINNEPFPQSQEEFARKWFYKDTNEKMHDLITGFNLKLNKDYTFDPNSSMYQLTTAGINIISKKISQNEYNAGTLERSSEWGEGWVPVQIGLNDFYIDFNPDITEETTTIRCIIEYGPWIIDDDGNSIINKESEYYTVLRSNDLVFRNLTFIKDLTTWDAAIGLNVTFNDKSNGHYPLYNGSDGSLLNPHDSEKDRILEADIKSSYTGRSYLNGQETLIWKIPKVNSMISIQREDFGIMHGSLMTADDPIFKTYSAVIGQYDDVNFEYFIYGASESSYPRYTYDNQIKLYEYWNTIYNKILAFNWNKYVANNSNITHEEYLESIDQLHTLATFNVENLEIGTIIITNDEGEETEANAILGYRIEEEITLFEDDDFSIGLYYIYNNILKLQEKIANTSDIRTVYNRLTYRIASSYEKAKTNNTISCFLIKNNSIVKTDVTMTFDQHGTAGTDYTFAIYFGELFKEKEENGIQTWEQVGSQEPVLTLDQDGYREIIFNLYDAKNEAITLTPQEKNDIINKWINGNAEGFFWGANSFSENFEWITQNDKEATDKIVRIAIKAKSSKTINDCKGYVLQISYTPPQNIIVTSTYKDKEYPLYGVTFTQLFPIVVRSHANYIMNASGFIYYSESGGNPRYFNDNIYVKKDNQFVDNIIMLRKEDNTNREIDDWSGYRADGTGIGWIKLINKNWSTSSLKESNNNDRSGFPALMLDEKGNYKIIPYPIYLENINSTPLVLEGWEVNPEDNTNRILVYTIPLVILQNKYQVPILNSWNGNLLIDEDNNRVMAATIAAGHKDNQNRFSGVIMGDVGSIDNINQERITTTTGLYGYHEGAQSFGFLENGTGFIGKSGTGRIHFDGTSGTIQSGNYSASGGTDGTKIDLDDGSIDMWGKGAIWMYDPETQKYKAYAAPSKGIAANKAEFSDVCDSLEINYQNLKDNNENIIDIDYKEWDREKPLKIFNKETSEEAIAEVEERFSELEDATSEEQLQKKEYLKNMIELLYQWYDMIIWSKDTSSYNTHIHLDTVGSSTKPYFAIEVPKYVTTIRDKLNTDDTEVISSRNDSVGLTSLIQINRNQFYLQTADYGENSNSGLKIDLKNGTLDSKGKLTINGAKGSKIHFGDATNYLELGYNTRDTGYLTSTGTINITGGTGSSIKFGSVGEGNYRFKADGETGKVTLSSLDFVKFDDGTIESGDASELDENGNKVTLYARDIKPQWMTFVTDISGVVHKSPVKITIQISDDIEVPYTIDEPYTYPTTDTQWVEGVTRTLHTLDEWDYSTTGFSIVSGPAQPYGPEGGDSSYMTTVVMDGYTKVTGTGVGYDKVYKKVSVPYTYNGEGSSTYDFVDSVILTVTKISMWALTNDSASPKTVTIS